MFPLGPVVGSAHSTDFRLIVDPPAPGPWNMGVDEALLMDAVENGLATLRFYQWSQPTLSLGYFQRYADREQHAASRECAVVRRQSGGGAILHDRELTYSLVVPAGNPLAGHAERLYTAVHTAFIAAISASSSTAVRPETLQIRGEDAQSNVPTEPFLCFQRGSAGDVVAASPGRADSAQSPLPANSSGPVWKVLGSAQRRHRGAILQHGSLLLEASRAAPELPGLHNVIGLNIGLSPLIEAVCTELAGALGIRLIPSHLPTELESKAAELANNKYGSPAWTKRR